MQPELVKKNYWQWTFILEKSGNEQNWWQREGLKAQEVLGRRRRSQVSARFKREYNATRLGNHTSRAQANSRKELHLLGKKTHYTYIINKKKNTNIISVFIKKCKNNHAKIVGSSQRTGIFCSKSLALVKIPKGYIRVLVIILLS